MGNEGDGVVWFMDMDAVDYGKLENATTPARALQDKRKLGVFELARTKRN